MQVAIPPATITHVQARPRYLELRVSCWTIALALGALQAWSSRFTIGPDAVSYLDIGDDWWHGNFRAAMNAYWSPLYSWILGAFLKVLAPPMYWEFPVAHLVNFLIFIFALASFELFLNQALIQIRTSKSSLTEPWYRVIGYSLYLSASLALIGLSTVTADMLVSAFVYLAAAFAMKIYSGDVCSRTLIAYGLILGFGYLAKTVLLPVGMIFLFMTALLVRRPRPILLSTAVLLMVTAPWVTLCSAAKHRFTIGESGRWNFISWVDDVWSPYPSLGLHAPKLLYDHPKTYDLANTVDGTYPAWHDPSYWQDGLTVTFDGKGIARQVASAVSRYAFLLLNPLLDLPWLILFLLVAISGVDVELNRPAKLIAIPCVCALAAYSILFIDFRYIGSFVVVLWLVFFLRAPIVWGKLKTAIAIGLPVILSVASCVVFIFLAAAENRYHLASDIAAGTELQRIGLSPGDRIGLLSTEQWKYYFTPCRATYAPRLAKLKIVAEIADISFWNYERKDRNEALQAMKATGAKAVLSDTKPPVNDLNWLPLGDSGYYLVMLESGRYR